MAGPWEKYQKPVEAAPWEKYKPTKVADKSEPPGVGQRLATAAIRGMMAGNPLLGILGEGMKQTDEAVGRAAYEAGGAVTDVATKAVDPETAAKLGFATNVAVQYVPSLLLGEAAKKSGAPLVKAGAKKLMQSALKPTLEQHQTGKAARAIETMLQEKASVSQGGVDKMRKLVDQLGDEVSAEIANSKAMINKAKVGQELRDVVEKFKNQVNPQADLATIRKAWENFANHPLLKGKIEIPIQTAQALKQGSYRALGDKAYGMGLKPEAEKEAQKALVRGLRKEIAKAAPAVEKPLAREAELINAAKVAQRRVLMDANKNPLGLGWLAQPWMIPFWMWDRSPVAKSLVARGLFAGAEQIPATAGRLGAIPAGMYLGEPPEGSGALYRR